MEKMNYKIKINMKMMKTMKKKLMQVKASKVKVHKITQIKIINNYYHRLVKIILMFKIYLVRNHNHFNNNK